MNDEAQRRLADRGSPAARAGCAPFRVGDWRVEPDLDRVVGQSGEIPLEPKTMAVLVHLAREPGRVVSTDELVRDIWLDRPMGDNPVYRCIAQLRRALGDDPKAPTHIATVPTKGYRLIAPVAAITMPAGNDLAAAIPPTRAPAAARPRPAARWALLAMVAALALLAWRPWGGSAGAGVGAAERPVLVIAPWRPGSASEADTLLARAATELVGDHLRAMGQLQVVAAAGKERAAPAGANGPSGVAGESATHRFVLGGDIARAAGRLRGHVRLQDAAGTVLWSSAFDAAGDGFGGIQQQVASGVADALGLTPAPGPGARVNLEAYQLYMRGRQLLADGGDAGPRPAVEVFRRATILDPGFARGYLGLGQAQAALSEQDEEAAPVLRASAGKAFDQALRLDRGLGEAMVGKAALEDDPARAESLFRAGLRLAPGDGSGWARYAGFLYGQGRIGEAMDTIEQGIRANPRSPDLYLLQASFVMIARSDVQEHDRLVRSALEIQPRSPAALYRLAYSGWEYRGAFAEAARLIERAIAIDPRDQSLRALARDIYLDLGDPKAAEAVLGDAAPPSSRLPLLQYRGDAAGAAASLADTTPRDWPDGGPQAGAVQALRDAAMESGDFPSALRRIDALRGNAGEGVPMWRRGFSLVHAHALSLAGEGEAGRGLAGDVLHLVEIHGVGRPANWFSRERASAHMVLGQRGQALQALQHSVDNGQVYRWWYLAGHDPLFASVRDDPRFRAMDQAVERHLDRQKALLEGMRQAGQVPARTLAGTTARACDAPRACAERAP